MDFAKMGQNLGQSLTGNISKAVLCIRNVNAEVGEDGDANDAAIDDLMKNETSAVDDVNKVNKGLMELAEKTLKGGKTASFKDVKGKMGDHNYIALELQYNPTSLRLDTVAGMQRKYDGEGGDIQVRQHITPASTTLSCDLLFNDFNNMDAFMLSDNPLTQATASNIANTVTSMLKGKYSVQRQMEGLLSLLAVPAARHVIFFWGAMSFRGELTAVTTRYTMFNKKGYPIRGTVGIQIRQGAGTGSRMDKEDAEFKYDETSWRKAFDATFTKKAEGQSTWRKATNNNLLNLKL